MNVPRRLIAIVLLLLLACAGGARADLSLGVEVGWSGHFRVGRWGPLFVTLSDTGARPVTLEVSSPHANGLGMQTRLALSVSPTPATYAVYVPMSQGIDEYTVTVRDPRTQRRLGEWPSFEQRNAMLGTFADASAVLVGTSGRAPTLRGVAGPTRAGDVQVVHVDPLRLPATPHGYDAFNVLVLNQPDLNRLSADQQQAIADWVRAGGHLVLWPAEDAVPHASPLVSALPVMIGDNVTLEIDRAVIERAGLQERFAKLRGRALVPKPGAERIPSLGDAGPDAWRGRVGFGQVLVLPFDPTYFVFRDGAALKDFWRPLLAGMIDLQEPDDDRGASGVDPIQQRRAAAVEGASNLLLGNVPGIGRFGFTYVAVVMIGLMIIVGPVDWLVLRYLGRQPWTCVTTSGWIALVTVSALFVGHLFKSGDLHFRTLRIIDQAEGQVVATTDFVGVYAPRTRVYEIVPAEREGWWQPGGDPARGHDSAIRNDVPFAQDSASNRPLPMVINVWNLRFLQGQTITGAPPVIEASLRWGKTESGQNKVLGTIRNNTSTALDRVSIRVGNGAAALPRVGAGATVDIDQPFRAETAAGGSTELFRQLCDLDPRNVDQVVTDRADVACIYAEASDAQPAVTITDPTAKQQHWQVVRALVPISTGEDR